MATVLDSLVVQLGFKVDTRSLRRAEQRIQATRDRLDSFASGALRVGTVASAALAAVGSTMLNFESAFNELSAVLLGESAENLDALRQQAIKLGGATSKSAYDAAKAQAELARQGQTANQVLASTPAVLNLAIAGNLEMAEAAELVSATLNSYQFDADQAIRITDLFAATASKSAFTVAAIGPAFRQVGSLAAGFGITIEQTLAALGTLRSAGLRADQTGTSLRNIMAILTEKPTTKVAAGFKKIQVNFDQMREHFLQSGDILGVMQSLGTAGLTAEGAIQIFGRESGNAAFLLSQLGRKARSLESDLASSAGTADKMRVVMEQGLPGAVAQLKSAFEAFQLSLGDAGLKSILEDAINAITGLIRSFTEASPIVKQFVNFLLLAGPALLALAGAAKVASLALGFFAPLMAVIGVAGKGAVVVFGLIKAAMVALGIAAGTISLPILLAVAAIAASVALIYAYWNPIKGFFSQLWANIAANSARSLERVKALLSGIADFSFSLYDAGAAMVQTLIDGIKSAPGAVYEALKGILSDARDLLPFSDAKEGPLSELTRSGAAIMETLARGVQQAQPLKVALMAGALALPPLEQAVQPTMAELAGLAPPPVEQAIQPTVAEFAGLTPTPVEQMVQPLDQAIRPMLGDIPALAQGIQHIQPILGDIPALSNLAAPLPVGPLPQPQAVASGPSAGERNITVRIDRIEIIAQEGNAREIAGAISDRLREEIRAATEEADSMVQA